MTDDDPGPITNNTILIPPSDGNSSPRGIRPNSDYAQINSTLWKFFYNTYGGGPEILLRGNPADDLIPHSNAIPSSDDVDELHDDTLTDAQWNENTTLTETNGAGQTRLCNGQAFGGETTNGEQPADYSNSVVSQNAIENGSESGSSLAPSVSPLSPANTPAASTSAAMATTTTTTTVKKTGKFVSFEDNDQSSSSDRDTPSSMNEHRNMRRGKHNSSTSPNNSWEILSKKDRRHRSIQSNGFFGPEGEYCEYTFSVQRLDCTTPTKQILYFLRIAYRQIFNQ